MIHRRKTRSREWLPAVTAVSLFLHGVNALAAGAAPAEKLVNIADTRNLPPGLSSWIANVYNTSYLQFGLIVVAIMAFMGLVLGYCCDRLVGLL